MEAEKIETEEEIRAELRAARESLEHALKRNAALERRNAALERELQGTRLLELEVRRKLERSRELASDLHERLEAREDLLRPYLEEADEHDHPDDE